LSMSDTDKQGDATGEIPHPSIVLARPVSA